MYDTTQDFLWHCMRLLEVTGSHCDRIKGCTEIHAGHLTRVTFIYVDQFQCKCLLCINFMKFRLWNEQTHPFSIYLLLHFLDRLNYCLQAGSHFWMSRNQSCYINYLCNNKFCKPVLYLWKSQYRYLSDKLHCIVNIFYIM